MNRRTFVDAGEMGHLIAPLLTAGTGCRFVCGGDSMVPLIRSGDTLTLAPINGKTVSVGDVLAYIHPHSLRLVVHRVVEIVRGNAVMKGDHVLEPDAVIPVDRVLGILVNVTRNGRTVWAGLGPERKWAALLSRMGLTRRLSSACVAMKRRIRLFCR